MTAVATIPSGPFSAELILIRGAGHPDVFPRHERRLHASIADRPSGLVPTVVGRAFLREAEAAVSAAGEGDGADRCR